MEGSRFRVSHTCRLLCYTHSDWVRQAATRNCQGDRVDWAVLRGIVMTTGKQGSVSRLPFASQFQGKTCVC